MHFAPFLFSLSTPSQNGRMHSMAKKPFHTNTKNVIAPRRKLKIGHKIGRQHSITLSNLIRYIQKADVESSFCNLRTISCPINCIQQQLLAMFVISIFADLFISELLMFCDHIVHFPVDII